MKAITTTGWGPNTKLVLSETDAPSRLRADDVLVEVHAASVNPKDWKLNYHLAMAATPVGTRRLPPIFGDDLAGVVIDKGRNVRHFEIGDEVYGMDMRLRTASLAEQARINQHRVAKKPANLSFNEAASLPLAALTALQGLRKGGATGQVRIDHRCLWRGRYPGCADRQTDEAACHRGMQHPQSGFCP